MGNDFSSKFNGGKENDVSQDARASIATAQPPHERPHRADTLRVDHLDRLRADDGDVDLADEGPHVVAVLYPEPERQRQRRGGAAAVQVVVESDEAPSNDLIADYIEALFGRRAGAFVGVVRDNDILFVTYEGRHRYALAVEQHRRGDFDNTDSGLDLDDIIEIAQSFADGDRSWWDSFHWERVRDTRRHSARRKKSRRKRHTKQPDSRWIYQERQKLTKRLRFEVLDRDGYRCRVCGASAETENIRLEVDHIMPVSHGGPTEPDNLCATFSRVQPRA